MRQIIMTCGNIGTGKSTTIKTILSVLCPGQYFVWSVDSIAQSLSQGTYDAKIWTFKHKELYDQLKAQLIAGAVKFEDIIVILDDCHMSSTERMKWTKLGKDLGYQIHLMVHKSQNNIDNRMKESRGYDRVLWELISKDFEDQWEEPTQSEGFDSITTKSF